MTTRSLTLTTVLTLALGLTACNGSKDSGDDTAAPGFGDGGDGGGDGGTSAQLESCDTDQGICFEFVNQSGISAWCDDIGNEYGWGTTYSEDPCPSGEEGTCENLTGGDYGSRTATAFYYSDYQYDQQDSCESAGGDFSG
jgi:hypothetical protein